MPTVSNRVIPLNSVRAKHLTGKLHSLGPRPLSEFLDRLVSLHPAIAPDLSALLEQYAAIDARFLKAAGLDQWPSRLVLVPDSIRAGTASHSEIVKAALHPSSGGDAA